MQTRDILSPSWAQEKRVSSMTDRTTVPTKKDNQHHKKLPLANLYARSPPRCPFCLRLFLGLKGYFIQAWRGNPYHLYHHQSELGRLPTKLLLGNEKQLIHDISGSGPSTARVAVHTHFTRTQRQGMPTLLTLQQVCYITKKWVPPTQAPKNYRRPRMDMLTPFTNSVFNKLCLPNQQA